MSQMHDRAKHNSALYFFLTLLKYFSSGTYQSMNEARAEKPVFCVQELVALKKSRETIVVCFARQRCVRVLLQFCLMF